MVTNALENEQRLLDEFSEWINTPGDQSAVNSGLIEVRNFLDEALGVKGQPDPHTSDQEYSVRAYSFRSSAQAMRELALKDPSAARVYSLFSLLTRGQFEAVHFYVAQVTPTTQQKERLGDAP